MDLRWNLDKPTKTRKWWKEKKMKEIGLISLLACILLFACWKVFYKEETSAITTQTSLTETERKISLLLEEIEGVGKASVMVCETEEGILGAVVVCEGANDIRVNINVREAVATALGTEEKAVKIYLKKS